MFQSTTAHFCSSRGIVSKSWKSPTSEYNMDETAMLLLSNIPRRNLWDLSFITPSNTAYISTKLFHSNSFFSPLYISRFLQFVRTPGHIESNFMSGALAKIYSSYENKFGIKQTLKHFLKFLIGLVWKNINCSIFFHNMILVARYPKNIQAFWGTTGTNGLMRYTKSNPQIIWTHALNRKHLGKILLLSHMKYKIYINIHNSWQAVVRR